jgi:hypothetical protein
MAAFAANSAGSGRVHRFANAMAHKASAFVGDPEPACTLCWTGRSIGSAHPCRLAADDFALNSRCKPFTLAQRQAERLRVRPGLPFDPSTAPSLVQCHAGSRKTALQIQLVSFGIGRCNLTIGPSPLPDKRNRNAAMIARVMSSWIANTSCISRSNRSDQRLKPSAALTNLARASEHSHEPVVDGDSGVPRGHELTMIAAADIKTFPLATTGTIFGLPPVFGQEPAGEKKS